jgi:hypothetical protein
MRRFKFDFLRFHIYQMHIFFEKIDVFTLLFLIFTDFKSTYTKSQTYNIALRKISSIFSAIFVENLLLMR